ncbi:MAG: hypothetical protein ACRD2B_14115 [Terriglobia bacterium]
MFTKLKQPPPEGGNPLSGGITMRKFRILVLGLAFGMVAWIVPMSVAPAFAASGPTPLASQAQQQPGTPGMVPQQQAPEQQPQREQRQQQQMEQQEQAQQQQSQQRLLLTGKVLQRGHHYLFHDADSNTFFRISNPSKVKRYKGKTIKVVCTVDQSGRTIHISRVERAS